MFGRNLDDGYIGTTTQDPEERFNQHKKGDLREKICETTQMDIIEDGLTKTQAYERERELRDRPNMGWNKRIGGGGIPDGKPVALYHIRNPGLTERFVKWLLGR